MDKIQFPKLCDNGQWATFERNVIAKSIDCGAASKGLATGISKCPTFPCKEDMLIDADGILTDIQLYAHTGKVIDGNFAFIDDGLKCYKDAVAKYPIKVQQFNVGNDKLCQLIMNHLGVDCLAAATNNPNFMAALHADITDCVGMMAELKNLFGKGTGRIVNSQLHSFLMLKQNNLSFPLFIEKFLEHRETTLANYGSLVHANHISIDDLCAGIFLSAIDQTMFKTKLDNYFVAHPTGRGVQLNGLLTDFQIYAREQRSELPVDYSVSMVASNTKVSTSTPAQRLCVDCKVPIHGYYHSNNKPFKRCKACSQLHSSKQQAALKPGPVVLKPSKSAVLANRSLVAPTTDNNSVYDDCVSDSEIDD